MAYTASALSFMIENLKKTVIVTGSQIPLSEARNDGVNNLLSALTIAGHYTIPEVLVVFDNKILRGNRSTKFSTSSLDSFKSPNFFPIG
jgi:lysophospholipase